MFAHRGGGMRHEIAREEQKEHGDEPRAPHVRARLSPHHRRK